MTAAFDGLRCHCGAPSLVCDLGAYQERICTLCPSVGDLGLAVPGHGVADALDHPEWERDGRRDFQRLKDAAHEPARLFPVETAGR